MQLMDSLRAVFQGHCSMIFAGMIQPPRCLRMRLGTLTTSNNSNKFIELHVKPELTTMIHIKCATLAKTNIM
jgi:hypothetical protein